MKENKNVFGIFSDMEDESSKLEGIVSALFAITDAMNYGNTDPKEFSAAINLMAITLQDFTIRHTELINEGCEISKPNRIETIK